MPLGVYLPVVHWFSDLNQFCNFIENVKNVLCLFVVFLLSFSNCIDSFSFFHFFFEKCWNWFQNCLWISFFSKLSRMIIIIIDPFVQKKPKLYFSKYFFFHRLKRLACLFPKHYCKFIVIIDYLLKWHFEYLFGILLRFDGWRKVWFFHSKV